MSLARTAINRPITMYMICAVIVLLGAISVTRLPVDLMPDVTYPSITIRVSYPGVGPLEMEELVARPIEQAVAAVAGVEQINSTASEGSATVRLNFAWGTNLNAAADDVRSRVDRVRGRLPEDADAPILFKFDASAMPIMGVGVEGNLDRVTLRELAQNQLSTRLERVPGVAAVSVEGGLRRQIHVLLSKEKIAALDLSVDRIVSLLRAENENTPLGEIDEGDTTYLLRSQGQYENLDQIRNLVVVTKGGVPVYLRDIADVKDATEDLRSFTRINGKPGIRMRVTKQSGENTVTIARSVRQEIDRINREVPNVKLSLLDDSSVYIEQSIAGVQTAARDGAVLVILIIFLFLRNIRSTLIIGASIPISVIGTFALLFFAGYTLNTMTFGALALGIGMIVDASIVVLENTFRHMEHGLDRVQASIEGAAEVGPAILASTLTHMGVFVPMLFLTGVSSIMFKQLAVVVIFSLGMSLFVAVTLVPVLCSKLLKLPTPVEQRKGLTGRLFTRSEQILDGVDDFYRRMLHKSLVHRPTVLLLGAGLFVVALVLLPRVGFELMPQTDEGEVTVDLELPVGTRIERTEAAITRMETMINQSVPEAVMLISNGGGGGFMGGSTHRGSVTVRLVPKAERTRSNEQIAQDLRRRLAAALPGVTARARASGGNNMMSRMFTGGGSGRLALEIRGQDLADARSLSLRAKAMMEQTPGIADAQLGREEGRPELAVRVDRPKAATLGLRQSEIAATLRTNVAGTTAAQFRERGYEYPIVVRLREADRESVRDVDSVMINTPMGRVMEAKNLLRVDSQTGPVQIERKNQERIARVNAEIETSLSEAVRAIETRVPSLSVPRDFSVGFGAEVEEQAKAFDQLQLMLMLALVLTYAVMAGQYESLKDPFIIMFSVPLAAIGVVGALLLTKTTFSLQAYIGVIMLAGIVVSNAILLVDYTNILRRRDGLPLRDAVETAGRTRLRPILMTSLTTMLGLLPLAMALGEGSEIQAPLARVVIGGLLTSTVITLVYVPAVYTLFEEGWSGLFKGARHHEPAGDK
jgi:hydrophobic/amphiphilic exporter-1 (mainly G- bacteria), HAE1 family